MAGTDKPGQVDLVLEQALGCSGAVRGALATCQGGSMLYPANAWVIMSSEGDPTKQAFLRGHDSCVSCLASTASGSMAASGETGKASDVVIWSLQTMTPIFRLCEHTFGVSCVAFSQDEKLLVSTGNVQDRKLVVWDTSSGCIVASTRLEPRPCIAVAWAPVDGVLYRFALVGEQGKPENNVFLYTVNPYEGTIECERFRAGQVQRSYTCALFSPDGQLLLCGTTSGDVVTYAVPARVLQEVIPVCKGAVTGVQGPAPNGEYLVSGVDGGVFLMNSSPGLPYAQGKFRTPGVLDIRCPPPLVKLSGEVTSLSYFPGSEDALAMTAEGGLYRVSLDGDAGVLREHHTGAVTGCAFSPTNPDVAATCSKDSSVILWNLNDYSALFKAKVQSAGAALCVCLVDSVLVSGWEDGQLRAHSMATGELIWAIKDVHKGGVTAVTASHNETFIVTGGEQGNLRVWDTRTRGMVVELRQHTKRITGLEVFIGDEAVMSCSRDESFIVWDVRKGCCLSAHRTKMGYLNGVALAPDQVQVVTVGSDKRISFWDLREKNPLQVIPDAHGAEGMCIAMSPDGSMFATGGVDQVIRLWQFDTGSLLSEVFGHSATICSLKFSPSGKQLLSAGADGMLAVWAFTSNAIV